MDHEGFGRQVLVAIHEIAEDYVVFRRNFYATSKTIRINFNSITEDVREDLPELFLDPRTKYEKDFHPRHLLKLEYFSNFPPQLGFVRCALDKDRRCGLLAKLFGQITEFHLRGSFIATTKGRYSVKVQVRRPPFLTKSVDETSSSRILTLEISFTKIMLVYLPVISQQTAC